MMVARLAPRSAPGSAALKQRIRILRKRDGYAASESAWARVRESQSKAGNSHTIIVTYRTDLRVGDHIVSGSTRLEILRTADLTGRRVFLKIDADAPTAHQTRRLISRLHSVGE